MQRLKLDLSGDTVKFETDTQPKTGIKWVYKCDTCSLLPDSCNCPEPEPTETVEGLPF